MHPLGNLHRTLGALGAALAFTATAFSQGVSDAIPESLDLETALLLALERNFDIQRAKQRIEEQNGLIIEIRAQALPDLSINGQYLEIDDGLSEENPFFPPARSAWSLALNARQTLYAGGGIRAALNAQKLVEEAALLELQSVVDEVLLFAREAYYGALLARARIAVREESVELLQELLQSARDRFEVGADSQFEVLRAEVELANARPALIRARNDYRIAVEELRQTLGLFLEPAGDVHQTLALEGELTYLPNDYDLESSLRQAQEARPELRRLEKVAEARREGVSIARADLRPEVNLIGSYQFDKASTSSRFGEALDGWTAGVEVRVPIFDGRRARGRIMQARSQADQAELDTRQTALAVQVEVRRAFSDLQAADELAGASIRVVEQAEESLRLANARYTAGEATQLDVLQARVSLTEARLNQAEAFYSYNVAEAQVRKAVGIADPYLIEP